ncbi:MAG: hypothetical protein JOZ62_07545, partial [Acidobacteriaceae bacterium]|nr:hypothetical protein [Acidobacteriaceae bacterium]
MTKYYAVLLITAALGVCLAQFGAQQSLKSAQQPPTYSRQPPTSDFPPSQQPPSHNHTKPDPPIIFLGPSPWSGPIAAFPGPCGQPSSREQEKTVSDHGPQCPLLYSMSSLSVLGFVQGSWPMVLDYELREPGIYLVTVSVEGQDPFQYLLDGSTVGHRQTIFSLPPRLGPKPVVANCTLSALSGTPGEVRHRYVRVFGWGCGPRAVGSVAIDQVRFSPPSVHP